MVERIESIVEQALVLTELDRAALIRRLIESLGPAGEAAEAEHAAEIERAWAEEIARRVERFERGEARIVPGDEVRRKIRKMIDGRVDG